MNMCFVLSERSYIMYIDINVKTKVKWIAGILSVFNIVHVV